MVFHHLKRDIISPRWYDTEEGETEKNGHLASPGRQRNDKECDTAAIEDFKWQWSLANSGESSQILIQICFSD